MTYIKYEDNDGISAGSAFMLISYDFFNMVMVLWIRLNVI